MALPDNADQLLLNFNPIELTPQERDRLRRALAFEAEQEALEEFQQLPGETMSEFYAARDLYLQSLEIFGQPFPRRACQAWQMVQGAASPQETPPTRHPLQLTLPFN
jgi:hypothetical protein